MLRPFDFLNNYSKVGSAKARKFFTDYLIVSNFFSTLPLSGKNCNGVRRLKIIVIQSL